MFKACEFVAHRGRTNRKRGNSHQHWWTGQYLFAPIAVETLAPLNTSACQIFADLGRKILPTSDDEREGAFLFQRVSVLVQR